MAILFLFTVLVRHLSMSVLEKSLVRIFRVCCLLFSYQCSFLLLPFHATAFILYQSVSCLSTTFLNYFLSLFIFISDNLYIISCVFCFVNTFFEVFIFMKSQAINAKLYLRNIISSFCTTMFAFCWQICTDCPSFRFALCLFYSFYASLASSSWNISPEVFHPNISLG